MTASTLIASMYSNGSEFPSLAVKIKGLTVLDHFAKLVCSGQKPTHKANDLEIMMPVSGGINPTQPLCGVYAVSAASGIPLSEAYAYFKRNIIGFMGGTTHEDRIKFFVRHNVAFTELETPNRVSVLQFARDFALPNRTYMVRTHRHVQTVRNGIVMDQQGPCEAAEYWQASAIITKLTLID